jgi:NAD+ kinase
MLQATLLRGGDTQVSHEALNDVVISRGKRTNVVRLTVHVNGEYLTTYPGDGVIISTPTGSTAYALDVGGPVLSPRLQGFLLIPMSPHLYMNRAIVFERGARINVQVSTEDQGMLTMDGQVEIDLQDADSVTIQTSSYTTRFVRLQTEIHRFHRLKSIPVLI